MKSVRAVVEASEDLVKRLKDSEQAWNRIIRLVDERDFHAGVFVAQYEALLTDMRSADMDTDVHEAVGSKCDRYLIDGLERIARNADHLARTEEERKAFRRMNVDEFLMAMRKPLIEVVYRDAAPVVLRGLQEANEKFIPVYVWIDGETPIHIDGLYEQKLGAYDDAAMQSVAKWITLTYLNARIGYFYKERELSYVVEMMKGVAAGEADKSAATEALKVMM